MKELIYLLQNAERNVQLYRYLCDAQEELVRQRGNCPDYMITGFFFSKAYGLDLGPSQAEDLGKAIKEGLFKPGTMIPQGYDKLTGSVEMYWTGLVNVQV